MSQLPLKIIGFHSKDQLSVPGLRRQFDQAGISISVHLAATFQSSGLIHLLDQEPPDQLILVLKDMGRIMIGERLEGFEDALGKAQTEVLFAASAELHFDDPGLHYFYWKHYPRPHHFYNYLDSTAFAGKAGSLLALFRELSKRYPEGPHSGVQDSLSRYYADSALGCFSPSVRVALDYEQDILASARLSARKRPIANWMYHLLYSKNEVGIYTESGRPGALAMPLNIGRSDGGFFQKLTKTNPSIVVTHKEVPEVRHTPSMFLNLLAMWRSLKQLLYIGKVNKWHFQKEQIFRYLPNKSAVMDQGIRRIVERLENRQPLSFAHYNDGELTFVRDYLNENHHNDWFGRQQQQYNPLLAERLYEAMRFRKDGYFVGVPCSLDHPHLRKEADQIVGDYPFKVQAMTIHHNLAFMPRILEALKSRTVYFFTNEYQDLTFFERMGVVVKKERTFVVPFRNSYLEYEQYKDMKFPHDAVVVLTCGMLAKILTKVWYESHDGLTILALGASLDDHIQKENIGFELYPKDTPLTRNLHKYRPFLFGYKKRCKECYDF